MLSLPCVSLTLIAGEVVVLSRDWTRAGFSVLTLQYCVFDLMRVRRVLDRSNILEMLSFVEEMLKNDEGNRDVLMQSITL